MSWGNVGVRMGWEKVNISFNPVLYRQDYSMLWNCLERRCEVETDVSMPENVFHFVTWRAFTCDLRKANGQTNLLHHHMSILMKVSRLSFRTWSLPWRHFSLFSFKSAWLAFQTLKMVFFFLDRKSAQLKISCDWYSCTADILNCGFQRTSQTGAKWPMNIHSAIRGASRFLSLPQLPGNSPVWW